MEDHPVWFDGSGQCFFGQVAEHRDRIDDRGIDEHGGSGANRRRAALGLGWWAGSNVSHRGEKPSIVEGGETAAQVLGKTRPLVGFKDPRIVGNRPHLGI